MALPAIPSVPRAAAALVSLALACHAVSDDATAQGHAFVDATDGWQLDFVHVRGASPEKNLPETMGSGIGWIDYDGDGRHDLYLVQSGTLAGPSAAGQNVLFRNLGGRFAAVAAGVADRGFGMGIAAADYDGDGWVDLFVSNFGADALYRNNGDGTFTRARSGVESERWSASAAWGDLDGDPFPELYVTRYVAYEPASAIRCGPGHAGQRSYCHVDLFDADDDSLYRHRGDGTFVDISAAAGVARNVEGKGLGVAMGDLNGDGRTDIYVANDTRQNFLYINRGDGTLEEQGLFSGTGYGADGRSQAGMGVEMADVDGDGIAEILVTNFAFEANNVYRQVAPGAWVDDGSALGFAPPGLVTLGFGIVALDVDGDGDREIAVANGHILDDIAPGDDATGYRQRNHLYDNDLAQRAAAGAGARDDRDLFREIGAPAGGGFDGADVSRGLAAGDADGDGRPDLVVTNSGGPAQLLLNVSGGEARRLVLRLRGRTATRDALGAQVRVTPLGGGSSQWAEVRSSSSYLSQSAGDLYFGLGTATEARVEVTWPGGSVTVYERIEADRLALLDEGASGPLTRPLRR